MSHLVCQLGPCQAVSGWNGHLVVFMKWAECESWDPGGLAPGSLLLPPHPDLHEKNIPWAPALCHARCRVALLSAVHCFCWGATCQPGGSAGTASHGALNPPQVPPWLSCGM